MVRFSSESGSSRGAFAVCFLFVGIAAVVTGCGPTNLSPTITVANSGTALTITGQGFTPTLPSTPANPVPQPCAQLSLLTLPQPNAVLDIGQIANCPNGSFLLTWHYSYAFCSPSENLPALVGAVDHATRAATSQPITFAWGPNCGLTGFCGGLKQPACDGQCQVGGVAPDGTCQLCGGEGQLMCSSGTACLPGLNPNWQGQQVVCTASCGNAIGSACVVGPNNPFCAGSPPTLEQPQYACVTQQSNSNVYKCYNSTLPPDQSCICQPNTSANSCAVSSSALPPTGGTRSGVSLCLPSSCSK